MANDESWSWELQDEVINFQTDSEGETSAAQRNLYVKLPVTGSITIDGQESDLVRTLGGLNQYQWSWDFDSANIEYVEIQKDLAINAVVTTAPHRIIEDGAVTNVASLLTTTSLRVVLF
jgi:hypothetical protein